VEQRVAWDDLPEPLKQAIEVRTGPIAGVRIASAGQNSPLAAIIDTPDGKVFVMGTAWLAEQRHVARCSR
jgi:hypothetical protein